MNNTNKGVVCAIPAIIAVVLGTYGGEIKTSKVGLELIGNAEGCRRDPYKCPADVLTYGVGSTNGPIDTKKLYTDEEIAARWVKDIKVAEQCVKAYIPKSQSFTQGQWDSIVSFTFNVGCGNLRTSTLAKKANAGQAIAMCYEFGKWVYAGKVKLNGLVDRRSKEERVCLTGKY